MEPVRHDSGAGGDGDPWIVWRFSDARPGHDNQTLGLVEALAELTPVTAYTLDPVPLSRALGSLFSRRLALGRELESPDLILGAGHATHLSLLAARRCRGGRTVVLMRPSLPLRWFDLCLIPEHDDPPRRGNVLPTRGALNRIRPGDGHDPNLGLFLVGGPSAHYSWDDPALWRQIAAVAEVDPDCRWILTTSRRTPGSFLDHLTASVPSNLQVVPWADAGSGWLPERLAEAGRVWVTADSVSMVYEALTAGAAVGILEVPERGDSRVGRGLKALQQDGWVTLFRDWRKGAVLSRPQGGFHEAARCARWIYGQWLKTPGR